MLSWEFSQTMSSPEAEQTDKQQCHDNTRQNRNDDGVVDIGFDEARLTSQRYVPFISYVFQIIGNTVYLEQRSCLVKRPHNRAWLG